VESAEDFVFAAVAVDGEGAALGPVGGGSLGESGIKLAGCNRNGFRQRFAWHGSLQRVSAGSTHLSPAAGEKEGDPARVISRKRKRPHEAAFFLFLLYKFRISG
jgi:hypothetical protein